MAKECDYKARRPSAFCPSLYTMETRHFELHNKTQEGYLQQIQPEMHGFLRKRLNNVNIKSVVHITQAKRAKKAYTAEERYKAMLKANPHLEDLRQALDLDIE